MKIKSTILRITMDRARRIIRSGAAIMLILFISNRSFAQNVNVIFSSSPSTVQVNQTFTVDVIADFINPGTLSLIETYINFNPLDLEVQSTPTVPGSVATALPNESVPFSSVATMNSSGHIDYGRFTISGSGHPNADFTFFTITFKALRVPPGGNTTLSYNIVTPRITTVGEGTPIFNQGISKTLNITSCTPPTASIANTGTCNSQAFNLVLNSATGTGPYSLVINGTTYNNINVGGTITTVTPASQNFFGNTTPGGAVDVPDAPVTLGLKFNSSVTGFVKGVRFFSQGAPSGTYTGQLWSGAGTLLASATFTGVTANAWQQVLFPAPVLIAANTNYVISYHTISGYMADETVLNSAITSGVLTAPATGTATPGAPAGNGLYTYDPVPASPTVNFPTSTFNATNYEVDVIFTPNNFTYDLTSVTDAGACTNVGAPLQSLSVTSIDCSTLPVTLLNLSATPKDKDVILRWSTATELDNKGFELQRRTVNGAWEGIAFVNGAGNSSSQINYSFTDKNLFSGRYFYQLKQVDIDGHYKYSMVVTANIDGKDEYAMTQNYPNPFRGVTTIQFTLPQRANVNITVFDMNGRTMKVLINGATDAGNHALNFYSGGLPTGMYYYRIQAGSFSAVKKMVIQ